MKASAPVRICQQQGYKNMRASLDRLNGDIIKLMLAKKKFTLRFSPVDSWDRPATGRRQCDFYNVHILTKPRK